MVRCCSFGSLIRKRNKKKIVLLLVGLDNAGKTTAARGLIGGATADVIPTVGFSSLKLSHRGMDVTVYDLGGGSQIRAIWKSYFSDVHGVIFVIDASDTSRIEECKVVLENLLRNDKLAGKPVLVLANKQDKPDALDQVDLVESLKLEPLVNEQKCLTLIEECSAVTYSHRQKIDPRLLHGYRWLVNQVAIDYEALNERVERDKKIDAEKFKAEREALRERISKYKENGFEVPHLNGDHKLPYRDNIIQVSPPPGVEVPSLTNKEESPVEKLTRHVRDQLERHSIKERHRKSFSKKNKIIPTKDNGPVRPKSESSKFENDDTLMIQSLNCPMMSGKTSLPPLKTNGIRRPNTSKSLDLGAKAWGIEKELHLVSNGNYETTEVKEFNEVHPVH